MYHPNHSLNKFDEIIIENSTNLNYIPSNYVNKTHIISQIIDMHHYDIVINNVNIITEFINNADVNILNIHGGFDIRILTPNKFRLRFDFPDTMGNQLGFRLVGLNNSITPYDTIITNDTPYEDDIFNISIRNSLKLNGPPYLLIKCQELENIIGNGNVKKSFYKINLVNTSDNRKDIAYDTFANTPIIYEEPLRKLERLTLEFVDPDGELYDFNGMDHSFVLEIITMEEIPNTTSIQGK